MIILRYKSGMSQRAFTPTHIYYFIFQDYYWMIQYSYYLKKQQYKIYEKYFDRIHVELYQLRIYQSDVYR